MKNADLSVRKLSNNQDIFYEMDFRPMKSHDIPLNNHKAIPAQFQQELLGIAADRFVVGQLRVQHSARHRQSAWVKVLGREVPMNEWIYKVPAGKIEK